MQQDIKQILARYLGIIATFIVGAFICAVIAALTGCTKTEYIAVPEYHYVDRYRATQAHDSVYQRDSIHESTVSRQDTVFTTKTAVKYIYKDRLLRDTLLVERNDSVTKPTVVTQTEYRYRTAWYDRLCRAVALAVALATLCYIVKWLARKRE